MKKKSMTIAFIDGLRKEAYILSQFNHPNIVMFKRIIETETQFFLVMECLHGGHLKSLMRARLEKKQKFSEEEASTIMQGITSALEYIHSKDIVHRDIKPGIFFKRMQLSISVFRKYIVCRPKRFV